MINFRQEVETYRGRILAALGFFVAWSLAMLWIMAHTVSATAAPAVTICHATGSVDHSFVTIHTNANAINGHFENNGTPKAGHEDDLLFEGTVNCPAPQPTHLACIENACTRVAGEGTDSCKGDDECVVVQSHLACVNQSCVFVEGAGENSCNLESNDCIKQDPQPEATPSATVSSGPSNEVGTPTPASCDGQPLKPAILTSFKTDGKGTVTFGWIPSTDQHEKQAIVYGYNENELNMGADNLPADASELTINGLHTGGQVWAQIVTFHNECAAWSNKLDP